MCEHVFSGCARGSGGWECGRCRVYWHIFGFQMSGIVCTFFCTIRCCDDVYVIVVVYFPLLLFVCAILYYLLAVLVGDDGIRSLSCCC